VKDLSLRKIAPYAANSRPIHNAETNVRIVLDAAAEVKNPPILDAERQLIPAALGGRWRRSRISRRSAARSGCRRDCCAPEQSLARSPIGATGGSRGNDRYPNGRRRRVTAAPGRGPLPATRAWPTGGRSRAQATRQRKCPKLVERGLALARTAQKFAAPNPRLARASRHYSNAPAGRGN
jgi:hypothetical protein